jgi:hypothetical protein
MRGSPGSFPKVPVAVVVSKGALGRPSQAQCTCFQRLSDCIFTPNGKRLALLAVTVESAAWPLLKTDGCQLLGPISFML